jgi:hypothetical protein
LAEDYSESEKELTNGGETNPYEEERNCNITQLNAIVKDLGIENAIENL